MGGALIGGFVANQGQEEQFENERMAAVQDVHREAYATYLAATIRTLHQLELKERGSVSEEEYDESADTAVDAESVVLLLADRDLEDVTIRLTNALTTSDMETVQKTTLREFIDLAKKDLAKSAG